jgi:pullulanase/glycogen debranching enzyme
MIMARAVDQHQIQIDFNNEKYSFRSEDVRLDGDAQILQIKAEGKSVFLKTSALDYRKNYYLGIKKYGRLPLDLGVLLDELVSEKPLGYTIENGHTVFRVFAPRATRVKLVLFASHTDSTGAEYAMQMDDDGVWEFALSGTHWSKYYGYKVDGPNDPTEKFFSQTLVADPYSKAVCTKNTYLHEAKTIILKTDDYDWEGDAPLAIKWEDLIIYELHVRDMTAHPSSGALEKGTYRGLIEKGVRGGINHILELGVNAVELLPVHEFGNIEIPFNKNVNGVTNTWNPYARNHWGYMTSYFFAPESYYASSGNMNAGDYCGVRGQQVNEFKDVVKAFHKAGIAVILDVVYNHVSQYDLNPLKYLDKKYYFRLGPMLDFLTFSGCGNDFKTERPMARRLIVDSVKYWLEEYHVDGFRFDLAAMIDWETVQQITAAAKKINPNVILIAEPWGGGKYDLAGFSDHGWGAWNDLIRNGVKGQNPHNAPGWIFGHYCCGNTPKTIEAYARGSTREYGGPFKVKAHSINYLESHDDHTLGDFIRLASGEVDPKKKIKNSSANARLSPTQLKLNKLAAVFLFTSQGAIMIGEGQELARSKVIAPTDAPDPHVGQIDHNSYNKDNETNWLNFGHKEMNRELFDYYRGLIELRKAHPAFRWTPSGQIQFLKTEHDFALGYFLPKSVSGDNWNFVVVFNSHPKLPAKFQLPDGFWRKVVDESRAGRLGFGELITGHVVVPPVTAMVLVN